MGFTARTVTPSFKERRRLVPARGMNVISVQTFVPTFANIIRQMPHLESQTLQFTKNGVQYVTNFSYHGIIDVHVVTTHFPGGILDGTKL